MALVSRCNVVINGGQITGVKNFNSAEREFAKSVKLMDRTDWFEVTEENKFDVDYAVPKGLAEYDFKSALDGTATVTVEKEGGGAYLFNNCKLFMIGSEKMDNENELVKTITIFAAGRTDEN